MANFTIPENPVYNNAMRKLEPTDWAHANLLNALYAQLLENGEYLTKTKADKVDVVMDNQNTYRGKNLGTSVTAAQKAAIRDCSFKDLYIGDYWPINGVDYLIADMDYWYNTGDVAFTKHHLVITTRKPMYTAQMNVVNSTGGGYVGSEMYGTGGGLTQAKETINATFCDMVLTHREVLVNAVSNGVPSAGAWLDSTVELMNECMVYGHPHYTSTGNGSSIPYLYTIDKTQLALFRLRPELIFNRSGSYWLRDVAPSARFAAVNSNGAANCEDASSSLGVRPVFAIG